MSQRKRLVAAIARELQRNSFCATGEGGGVDPSCGKEGSGQEKDEKQEIIDAYKAAGKEALSGKGGFFVKGQGFVSLVKARKETGINKAKKREPRQEMQPWGDYATIAAISGYKFKK